MNASPRQRRGMNASPAACLIPQIREQAGARNRNKRRKYYENESPGKLYTYVSAGNIETPAARYERAPAARHGARSVYVLAILLVLIWLVF